MYLQSKVLDKSVYHQALAGLTFLIFNGSVFWRWGGGWLTELLIDWSFKNTFFVVITKNNNLNSVQDGANQKNRGE